MVQQLHHVDEFIIAASNAIEHRESVSAATATKATPVATQNASVVHPLYRRDLNIGTSWRTKSERQMNLLQP